MRQLGLIAVLFVGMALCMPTAYGGADDAVDAELWNRQEFITPLKGPFSGRLEVFQRWNDNASDFNVNMIRPSITYRVNDHLRLSAGYAWFKFFAGIKEEHRVFQRAVWTYPIGKWTMIQRAQLDERFFSSTNEPSFRGRYLLGVQRPIRNSESWYWMANNELLVNMNHTLQKSSGVDQYRASTGVGYHVTKHMDLESWYIGIYRPGRNQWSNVLFLNTRFHR